MSKTYQASFKTGSTAKLKAERELLVQRTMKRAAHFGFDPKNSQPMQAMMVGRGFPETIVIDGKRYWNV